VPGGGGEDEEEVKEEEEREEEEVVEEREEEPSPSSALDCAAQELQDLRESRQRSRKHLEVKGSSPGSSWVILPWGP
jgi:hypothetical protein